MLIAGRLLGGLFMESWARWKEAVLASTAFRIVTKGAMPGRTNFPSLDWSGLPIFSPLNNTDKQAFGYVLCFLLRNKRKLVVLKMKCQNPFCLRNYYIDLCNLILILYFKFCSIDCLESSVMMWNSVNPVALDGTSENWQVMLSACKHM